MYKWWRKLEYIVEKSRLRGLFTLLGFIALIAFLVKRNVYTALALVAILGFFVMFAGLTPSFLQSSREQAAKFIPSIVAAVVFSVLRTFLVVVGILLIIIGGLGLYSYAKTGVV